MWSLWESTISRYQQASACDLASQASVYHEHSRGVSQKALSERYKKGKATIERWYQRQYEEQHRELMNQPCPVVLGIDEHSFSKKAGFATTLCDLRKHKVFDVVRGRSEADLKEYLQQYMERRSGENVAV